jgi:hypothetical protein
MDHYRYQRGSRSLADNLQQNKDSDSQRIGMTKTTSTPIGDEEEEEYDIPDDIEEVIGKNHSFVECYDLMCTTEGH